MRLDDEDVGDFAGAEAIYRVALGLDESASLEDVNEQLDAVLSKAELTRARDVLATGSSNDVKVAERLAAVLKAGGVAGVES